MCGRYSQTLSWAELAKLYRLGANATPLNVPARYNIAPSQDIPIVRRVAGSGRELVQARWGLIPVWAKEAGIGYKMINARAETVAEKPAFRQAFRKRRCLVAATGFYEWRKTATGKQPYFITLAEEAPFAFAGLWERWRGPSGETITSATIIVTAANALMTPIHDRMPAILTPDRFDAWLDTERPLTEAETLLAPFEGAMTLVPVSTRVNNVRYDDSACQDAEGPAITALGTTVPTEAHAPGSELARA